MDIKQTYREETSKEPYHSSYGDYGSYSDEYVKWIEAKLTLTDVVASYSIKVISLNGKTISTQVVKGLHKAEDVYQDLKIKYYDTYTRIKMIEL